MKPIRWTAHARKKVAAREVSMAEIEQTIARPDSIVSGHPQRRIFMRRYFDDALQSEMLLRVVAGAGGPRLSGGGNRRGNGGDHALQDVTVQEI